MIKVKDIKSNAFDCKLFTFDLIEVNFSITAPYEICLMN